MNMNLIDLVSSIISITLGFLFSMYLEKNIWPNFNKKHGLEQKDKNE